jgi:hypothetical protein
MTKLLEEAFEKVSKLPEEDQEGFARWLLAELESESKWDELFSRSSKPLSALASEALSEFEEGQTEPLDPENL